MAPNQHWTKATLESTLTTMLFLFHEDSKDHHCSFFLMISVYNYRIWNGSTHAIKEFTWILNSVSTHSKTYSMLLNDQGFCNHVPSISVLNSLTWQLLLVLLLPHVSVQWHNKLDKQLVFVCAFLPKKLLEIAETKQLHKNKTDLLTE